MIINVHAGHNPDGKRACGAIGLIKESTEARKVKDEAIRLLRGQGHTVYDCTCNNGRSQSDVLNKIVKMCNAHKADMDISIHFNSGAGDRAGNGRTTGVEALVCGANSKAASVAQRICEAVAALGYKNRGVKHNPGLYVLRKTSAPALLIECCFVDDKDDVRLYDYRTMAAAIIRGITGQSAGLSAASKPQAGAADGPDYSAVFNADYYARRYADLKAAFGTDAAALLQHFLTCGMREGRQAIDTFNVLAYRSRYPDLQQAFAGDLPAYYRHYIQFGRAEGRRAY